MFSLTSLSALFLYCGVTTWFTFVAIVSPGTEVVRLKWTVDKPAKRSEEFLHYQSNKLLSILVNFCIHPCKCNEMWLGWSCEEKMMLRFRRADWKGCCNGKFLLQRIIPLAVNEYQVIIVVLVTASLWQSVCRWRWCYWFFPYILTNTVQFYIYYTSTLPIASQPNRDAARGSHWHIEIRRAAEAKETPGDAQRCIRFPRFTYSTSIFDEIFTTGGYIRGTHVTFPLRPRDLSYSCSWIWRKWSTKSIYKQWFIWFKWKIKLRSKGKMYVESRPTTPFNYRTSQKPVPSYTILGPIGLIKNKTLIWFYLDWK